MVRLAVISMALSKLKVHVQGPKNASAGNTARNVAFESVDCKAQLLKLVGYLLVVLDNLGCRWDKAAWLLLSRENLDIFRNKFCIFNPSTEP